MASPRAVSSQGFTVLQLTILIATVAIFAAAAMPLGLRALELAEEQAGRDQLAALNSGLIAFQRDHGRFPTRREGIDALLDDTGDDRWRGPYLRGGSSGGGLVDPRGGPVLYELTEEGAVLTLGGFSELEQTVSAVEVNDDRNLRADDELTEIAVAYRAFLARYEQPPTAIGALVPEFVGADYALDPWGRPYRIHPGTHTATSDGIDGEPGTLDDRLRDMAEE